MPKIAKKCEFCGLNEATNIWNLWNQGKQRYVAINLCDICYTKATKKQEVNPDSNKVKNAIKPNQNDSKVKNEKDNKVKK